MIARLAIIAYEGEHEVAKHLARKLAVDPYAVILRPTVTASVEQLVAYARQQLGADTLLMIEKGGSTLRSIQGVVLTHPPKVELTSEDIDRLIRAGTITELWRHL